MRQLPSVETLQQAVREVIESNKRDGYVPTRFIQVTEDGNAAGLLSVCEGLITKGETLEWLDSALRRHPNLLTLEDFVARLGEAWGMSDATIQAAKARVTYFDRLAGAPRLE